MYLLLSIVALCFLFEKRKANQSKFFYVSNGMSRDVYTVMHKDGMSREDLDTFVKMEDRFLEYEVMSVSMGITHIVQATFWSNKIKDRFPKYNFSHHTLHLKQIAEPQKSINRVLN